MMAEKNSNTSHSAGSHQRGVSIGRGWETAKGEFYQEAFHLQQGTMSSDTTTAKDDNQPTKQVDWDNVLPSKRTKTIDTRTWGRNAGTTRRMSTRTLRGDNGNSPTAADIEMETMPDLAQGFADEEETWNKLQLIRTLPVDMAKKRELKAEIMSAPMFRMRGLGLLKFRRRQLWRRFLRVMSQTFSFFSPWRSSLRAIEANFGTGVASYFLLIRWLFFLNLVIAAVVAIFIVLPWEIGKESCPNYSLNGSVGVLGSEPVLLGCSTNSSGVCDDTCVARSDSCWLDYRASVLATVANHSDDPLQLIQDAVQGTGWLELTFAFYGYYQPAVIPWSDVYSYKIGLGYELAVISILLFSLTCITKSVAAGFKDNINLGRTYLHHFSDVVFTSWDYCIDSAKVAQLKKKSITNAIRVALEEKAHAEEKASRTTCFRIRLFFIRTGVNFLVIITLSLSGYIIYLVTDFSERSRRGFDQDAASSRDETDIGVLVVGFLPSMVITALNYLVPILFRCLVRPEQYSARFEINLTLIRTIFLRLASLLVLVLTLYSSLKRADSVEDCYHKHLSHAMCWETYVGQQLYRLCIFDVALTLFRTLLLELPSALLLRQCVSSTGRFRCVAQPEFNLVGNILDLVYGQSICWLGSFYCPILPAATALKCIIVFYTKYMSLTTYSLPPSRLYGASSSTSLFMNVMLISFISCALPLGYHVTSLRPSASCGPFRGLATVWSAVSHEVAMQPGTIREILFFFGTAGFFVPAILLLLVALYYYRSKAAAQRAICESLTKQLIMETEDKQFLLSRLAASTLVQPQPL